MRRTYTDKDPEPAEAAIYLSNRSMGPAEIVSLTVDLDRQRVMCLDEPTARLERHPEGSVAAVQNATAAATYDTAGRIGLQFKRRFWEQDDKIYGRSRGPTRRSDNCSTRRSFGGNKGIVVGYHLDFAGAMVKRPPAEIQRMALEQGVSIHPQYLSEVESAFSVTWGRTPWNRGSWRWSHPRRCRRSRRSSSPTAGCTSRATT